MFKNTLSYIFLYLKHLEYLQSVNQSEEVADDGPSEETLEAEILSMDEEILLLQNELETLNCAAVQTSSSRSSLTHAAHEGRKIRDAMTQRLNQLTGDNHATTDQIASVDDETNRVIATLDRYKQINAMNDAFYIWYAGPYATINSFRLGNLTNKPIEHTEINAALGQAALVLHVIALKANIELKHFLISPMGSFPKIVRGDDRRTTYPLFIDSSSFTLFPTRNFNLALQGFMSCIQEVGEYISNYDPTLSVPYKISVHESRIGDLSFVYGSDDEVWTRALKFMLADIKWIIAWYTKHCNSNINDNSSQQNSGNR